MQAPGALHEARRLLEAGDDQAAIDVLEKYLEDHPDDDEALELLFHAHRAEEGTETGKVPSPFDDSDKVEVEELDRDPAREEPIESPDDEADEISVEEEQIQKTPDFETARQGSEPQRDIESAPAPLDDALAEQVPPESSREATDSGLSQHPRLSPLDSTPGGQPGASPPPQREVEEATTVTTLVTPAGPRRKRISPLVMVVSGLLVASVAFFLITRPWNPSPSPEPSDTTPPVAEADPPRPQDDLERPQEPLANPDDADTVSEKSLELTSNESELEDAEVPEAPREDDGAKSDLVEAASIRPGTLIVLASPWAKVVSIRDENHEEVAFEKPAFTPFRLDLPPGRYSVSLERPELPVCTRSVQITPSAVTATACKFGELEPMDLLERIGS